MYSRVSAIYIHVLIQCPFVCYVDFRITVSLPCYRSSAKRGLIVYLLYSPVLWSP